MADMIVPPALCKKKHILGQCAYYVFSTCKGTAPSLCSDFYPVSSYMNKGNKGSEDIPLKKGV